MNRAFEGAAGVCSMFLYIVGSVGFAILATEAVRSEDPFDLTEQGQIVLGVCAGALLLAVVFQAIRERGGDTVLTHVSPTEQGPERAWLTRKRFWLSLIAVPTLISWIEFEMFVQSIDMFPLLTLIGGLGFGITLANAFALQKFKSTQRMLAVALVGLPLGFMAIGVPSSHFRYHGSAVDLWGVDELGAFKAYTLDADPDPSSPMQPIMGEGELALLRAFANAEKVSAGQKLESGEWKYIDDTLHERVAPGEYVPLKLADARYVEELFDDARKDDEKNHTEVVEAHRRALERRRQSGRLFTKPPDPSR
ncbi:MAG: hypothetical protein AAFX94_02160 [Myxococcota bacterium]